MSWTVSVPSGLSISLKAGPTRTLVRNTEHAHAALIRVSEKAAVDKRDRRPAVRWQVLAKNFMTVRGAQDVYGIPRLPDIERRPHADRDPFSGRISRCCVDRASEWDFVCSRPGRHQPFQAVRTIFAICVPREPESAHLL